MTYLRISLFGSMRIYQDDLKAEIKLTRIVQDLLAYLLLQRHRLHPREVLLDVFWKDANEKQARGCLNTALWRLRCALEPEGIPNGTYLVSTNLGEVGFNPDSNYWLDVADFEEKVTHAASLSVDAVQPAEALALERALALYRGDLLDGNYEDWAIREREHQRRSYLNALAYLMEYYRYHKAYAQALTFGEKILRLDPLREEVHRAMMRLYCDNGQRADAIQQYQICQQILRKELDIPPMEETQALFQEITHSQPAENTPQAYAIVDLKVALHHLKQATLRLETTHKELVEAIQVVENFTRHPPG